MSDVIGRGVIELSADSSGLNAAIDKARRSISSLGDAAKAGSEKSSQSIDRYIKNLEKQRAVLGMTARETELYKLALRGASDEQLRAADTSLKLTEAYQRGELIGDKIRTGLLTIGAAAVTGLIAAAAAFDHLIKKAGDFQDLAEKTGDTAENIASLAVSAAVGGVEMDAVAGASEKLTKNLTGVDDESKAAGAAIKALGLDLKTIKEMKPADQLEAIGKALNGFEDGPQKTAVAMSLLGKSGAEMLPFLKELGTEGGRQVILTQQQIELADEYADKQAKLRAEISMHAQAIATEMLPAVNDFTKSISELAKDQEFAAAASDTLKGAFSAAVVVFQTIAVLGSELGFVFLSTGREIGAMAAQLAALAHLDFSGFRAISNAVTEDGERARAKLDAFQAKIMTIGQPVAPSDPANYSNEGRGNPQQARPALKFDGAVKKPKAGKAGQEAKAQLALDLDEIRKAALATTDAYSNAEKIMQARRAANLIEDQDYYAAKLGFLRLNSAAQEAELQKEIERLQREKLSGKDKIDNDRKIADTQAKLAKVRADSVANIEINAIQEESANKKIAQSYVDAATAAQSYLDTINKQNQREIDGIGKGAKFRENQAGISQIEDKQTTARQSLEHDKRNGQIDDKQFDTYLAIVNDTYTKEIDAYDKRTAALNAKQSDWINGATEALQNYYDESKNIAKQFEDVFTNAFKGLEDTLVKFTETGKLDFKSLIGSIASDINRITIKEYITGPLSGLLKDQIGGGQSASKSDPLAMQTASVAASTSELDLLAAAARNAAGAIGAPAGSTAMPSIATTGDFARFDRGQTGEQATATLFDDAAKAQKDAGNSADLLGKNALTTATDLSRLAQSAGAGNNALSLLPNIIRLIQMSTASSGGGSSGGGIFGSIIGAVAGFFGGTGDAISNDASGSMLSATGDMIRGRRATGGPVAANSLYEVNEKGPEILEMGGRQYLMTGNKGGNVIPNHEAMGESSGAIANAGVTNKSSSITNILHTIATSNASNNSTFNSGDITDNSTLINLMHRIGMENPQIAPNLNQSIAAMDKNHVNGARELGGPVSAGGLYRVNEKRPELLQVAGKQYLMMGGQSGHVDANTGNQSKGGDTILHVNVTPPAGSNTATAQQWGATAGRQMQHAMKRNN